MGTRQKNIILNSWQNSEKIDQSYQESCMIRSLRSLGKQRKVSCILSLLSSKLLIRITQLWFIWLFNALQYHQANALITSSHYLSRPALTDMKSIFLPAMSKCGIKYLNPYVLIIILISSLFSRFVYSFLIKY